jgi:arsenate reductase
MAEGFLKSFAPEAEVHSAGTFPTLRVHPMAIRVMQEVGIDITAGYPKSVDVFVDQPFDYVITVCDDAKEFCPVFTGTVKHRLHIGFDDPSWTRGTESEILSDFRRVRDEIKKTFHQFYAQTLTKK